MKRNTTLAAIAAFVIGSGPALAATFATSGTAPTTDGADIANLDLTNAFADFGTSVIWGDRPARGQTFTTGANANGYTLSAITVQSTGAQAADGSYTVRVGQISGTSILVTANESTGTVTTDVAADDWITFTLDNPIQLLPNTVYGFDIGRQGNGWQLKNNITADYAGGTAYSSGANGFGGATISTHAQNRIFHLDMTVSSADITKPTLTDITDNVGGGPIYEDRVEILYTLTFDEAIDLSTIDLADFENLGTGVSLASVEEVKEIGGPFPLPSVITVRFGISGIGTLRLGVATNASIADNFGNTVNSPVADGTTITVNSGPTPNTPGDRYWDGLITSGVTDGVSQGGNGTWNTDTENTNWDPGLGFANPIAWNNANLDTAILGGTAGTITLGAPITAGGITSSATYTINSNTLTLDVSSGTPIVNTTSGTLTINSEIAGSKGLQKTGTGVIRFSTSTTHSYSGGFTLAQGELNVEGQGSNDSFLGTGTFTINGGTLIRMSRSTGVAWTSDNDNIWTGGTILFTRPSGDNPKWKNDGNIILQGNVTLDRSGSINYGVIMNGDISEDGGSFSLTLNGGTNTSSEFTLAGNNTYSGGTTIGGRSLFLNSSGALGTGPLAVNATILDNTSGSPVTIGNANPINLNGNLTFVGTNDLNLGTGAVTMNANRTVTVTARTLTVGGDIGQSGGDRTLGKAGNGTLELSGDNTYAGNTTVSAGTLALVGGSQNSAITVNSGASLGFTLGSPTTSTKALTLIAGHAIAITGSVNNASNYKLMTATSFTGVVAGAASITDYELQVLAEGTELWLVYTGAGGGGSAYDTWASVNAPSGDPDEDYDGDGVSNAVEFVLGGDKDTNDLDKLPMVATDGTNMTFTFERDQASIDPSVSVSIEVSTDLVDWSSNYAVPDVETAGPPVAVVKDSPTDFDTVTLTVAKAPDTKKFARLKVVITP